MLITVPSDAQAHAYGIKLTFLPMSLSPSAKDSQR